MYNNDSIGERGLVHSLCYTRDKQIKCIARSIYVTGVRSGEVCEVIPILSDVRQNSLVSTKVRYPSPPPRTSCEIFKYL